MILPNVCRPVSSGLQGLRRVLRAEDGWFVGTDAGEWGGALWWYPPPPATAVWYWKMNASKSKSSGPTHSASARSSTRSALKTRDASMDSFPGVPSEGGPRRERFRFYISNIEEKKHLNAFLEVFTDESKERAIENYEAIRDYKKTCSNRRQ